MLDSLHIYIHIVLPGMTQLTRKSPIALRLILKGLPSPETEAWRPLRRMQRKTFYSIFEVGLSAPWRESNCVYAILCSNTRVPVGKSVWPEFGRSGSIPFQMGKITVAFMCSMSRPCQSNFGPDWSKFWQTLLKKDNCLLHLQNLQADFVRVASWIITNVLTKIGPEDQAKSKTINCRWAGWLFWRAVGLQWNCCKITIMWLLLAYLHLWKVILPSEQRKITQLQTLVAYKTTCDLSSCSSIMFFLWSQPLVICCDWGMQIWS